ncbi:hypothetical protein [Streptomyces alfalfae]
MTISAYPITPANAAQITADLYGLPTGRLSSRETAAHAFVDTLDDLTTWLAIRGGYTTRERAGGGLHLWTLRTTTEPRQDGTRTPVFVHVTVLDEEPVPDELTAALA